jgi:hypothetical protein
VELSFPESSLALISFLWLPIWNKDLIYILFEVTVEAWHDYCCHQGWFEGYQGRWRLRNQVWSTAVTQAWCNIVSPHTRGDKDSGRDTLVTNLRELKDKLDVKDRDDLTSEDTWYSSFC